MLLRRGLSRAEPPRQTATADKINRFNCTEDSLQKSFFFFFSTCTTQCVVLCYLRVCACVCVCAQRAGSLVRRPFLSLHQLGPAASDLKPFHWSWRNTWSHPVSNVQAHAHMNVDYKKDTLLWILLGCHSCADIHFKGLLRKTSEHQLDRLGTAKDVRLSSFSQS